MRACLKVHVSSVCGRARHLACPCDTLAFLTRVARHSLRVLVASRDTQPCFHRIRIAKPQRTVQLSTVPHATPSKGTAKKAA
jgi:hypothetical protein